MADIVVNGGFEADVIGSPYVAFASGSTFTGWTVTGPVGSGVDLVRKPEYSPLIPFGNQAVDLSGTPGPGGISQILNTTANTSYVLQFTVGSNSGPYANSLNVYWNGNLLANLSAPAQGLFQTYTYTVQSAGTSTGLAFESLVGGNQGPTLDGVSVNAVPEPSAFAALGVAAFAAIRFRRKA